MNTQHGTLTIRSEIAVPMQDDTKSIMFKRATLATYQVIPKDECAEIIDRFCAANNLSRLNLFCEWKYVAHF